MVCVQTAYVHFEEELRFIIWAYGNLRGGEYEYSLKLGSFNLSIILLTNFYTAAITVDFVLPVMWTVAISAIGFPLLCLGITWILYTYLKEFTEHDVARGVLIGGTLGYMISMIIVGLIPPL